MVLHRIIQFGTEVVVKNIYSISSKCKKKLCDNIIPVEFGGKALRGQNTSIINFRYNIKDIQEEILSKGEKSIIKNKCKCN